MNLLLQQETKVLRAENERKMKKKARQRVSLGNNLFISVQEGRDRIQECGLIRIIKRGLRSRQLGLASRSTTLQWLRDS
jgi:hypothetical protein